jgi:hypothetical protein
MATASRAGAGSSMSNMQTGTRGLSAGDWIRLQRIRGAKTYATVNLATDKDIAPPPNPQLPHDPSTLIKPVVGTSRIRRTASQWTDYRASQTADFVTSENTGRNGNALSVTRLCDCSTAALPVRLANCTRCSVFVHNSIH